MYDLLETKVAVGIRQMSRAELEPRIIEDPLTGIMMTIWLLFICYPLRQLNAEATSRQAKGSAAAAAP
jgi:hypothetical protein